MSLAKTNYRRRLSGAESLLPLMTRRLGTGLSLSLVLMAGSWPLSLAAAPETAPKPVVNSSAAGSSTESDLRRYEAAIEKKTFSEADFQSLAKLAAGNPTNARVHLVFGEAYDALGLVDEAVDQYKLADQYGPRDPEAICKILHNLLGKGGGQAANTLLNSAIQRFPNNPEILYLIGKRLKEERHFAQAGKVLVRAYNSGARVKGLASDLGDLLITQEPFKAIAMIREDLRDNPDYAPGLLALSKALMSVGNYAQAVEPLQKLFAQAPNNAESTQMYVRALFWSGDFKRALLPALYDLKGEAQAAVSELPTANTLANICGHLSSSFVDAGLQDFYQRCQLEKKLPLPPFHFFLGRIFFRESRLAAAKSELLQYLKADPKSAETLWMLGRIAEVHDHDYSQALSYYRYAHAILPYNPRIEGSQSSLEEKLEKGHSDWAWSLREWIYKSLFGSSK
ncbi:MAG: tetratricopeptide repeat protein [Cyanobacteria bacterium REEB67]|nr:tetratricopeptide repeat protein [Cyanobacteria bacterium REEB67]